MSSQGFYNVFCWSLITIVTGWRLTFVSPYISVSLFHKWTQFMWSTVDSCVSAAQRGSGAQLLSSKWGLHWVSSPALAVPPWGNNFYYNYLSAEIGMEVIVSTWKACFYLLKMEKRGFLEKVGRWRAGSNTLSTCYCPVCVCSLIHVEQMIKMPLSCVIYVCSRQTVSLCVFCKGMGSHLYGSVCSVLFN